VPPLHLQECFSAKIENIDKLKYFCITHLDKLEALFASLRHRAFTGELTSGGPTRQATQLEMVG
jgi:type I restriction enzyme S subunit